MHIKYVYERNTLSSQQSMLPMINQITLQTVVAGEHLKNVAQWTILVCICSTQAVQLCVTNTASMKAQWTRVASALPPLCLCVQCETGVSC